MSSSSGGSGSSSRPLYGQQDPELRRLKEAFVSNLAGTTRWEVFCVLSSLPLCLLIASYIEARLSARLRSSSLLGRTQQARQQLPKFPFEFCGAVLPLLLLLMSVAPAEPAFLLLFLLWGSLALKLWMRLAHGPAARQHMAHMLQHMACSRKRFVSAFRGGVMMATCLAILGVDFPAFPRRYAKAEGYGGGVMDVGVGAIIFAGGLVSAVAAGAASAASADAAAAAAAAGGSCGGGSSALTGAAGAGHGGSGSWLGSSARLRLQQLLHGLRAAVPLLLLGGAREVATAVVGYQAHLGEYGLNWNFFYTIAAVALLTLALPVPPRWLGPLGLLVTGGHQLLLSLNLRKLLPAAGVAAAAGVDGEGMGGSSSLLRVLQQLPGLLEGGWTTCSNASAATGSSSTCAAGAPSAAAAIGAAGGPTLGAWLHLDLGVEARQAAGFLASNKEGLGSLPGYWALHLLGAAVGHQLGLSCAATAARARAQLSSGSGSRPGGSAAAVGEAARLVWAWVGVWWVVDLVLWGLLALLEAAVEPVSRRACNLPYVVWTAAQCLAWLLLVLMADLLTSVICSTSGVCGISPGSSSLLAGPAAAAGHHGSSSGPRGPVRRSLEAAGTASYLAHPDPAQAGTAAAAAAAGQQSPLPPSPKSGLHRRSMGRRGSSGSSPMAAAASAALTAAAVGSGGIAAGGSTTAVAAAAAAVMGSPRHTSSSPRKQPPGKAAAAAAGGGGASPKGAGSDKGSPKGGGSDHSSSSSPQGGAAGAGGSGSSTPARARRQGTSRMQPQQQQQQREEPSSSSSSSSSGSSGGPMRLMLAFNRNMLALFLAANLLTGAVNLSINTLEVGSWAARMIVGLYMLLLCGLAVLLDKRGLTLKL